jgi:hypothetical protein
LSRAVLFALWALMGACDDAQSGAAADLAVSQSLPDLAGTDLGAFDPGPEPTSRIQPVAGEVTLIQLLLPIGVTLRLGESAIIVGPDGTLVLIDVGESNHDDDVRDAVRELNTQWLIPSRGFPARQPLQVDWLIVTHYHGDHMGGFHALVTGAEPLQITNAVIHRGFYDVGAGTNEGDFETLCNDLSGALAAKDMPLCTGSARAPCAASAWSSGYPASGCPGLFKGDLSRGDDDAAGVASFIPLGAGARLTLLGADTFVSNGTSAAQKMPLFSTVDTNEENARSLIGWVSHGGFRYQFAGDLSGSGAATEPDIESHLASTASSFFDTRGADVIHASHHARRTSSNSTLAGTLAPIDGRARNVIAGINDAYVGSPHAEVLATWLDDDRLAHGWFWVTKRAPSSANHARLIEAAGPLIVQTLQSGRGYRVQAAGATLTSHAFPALR